eukprot:Colp12_sorted_trinity150504_noHs@31622
MKLTFVVFVGHTMTKKTRKLQQMSSPVQEETGLTTLQGELSKGTELLLATAKKIEERHAMLKEAERRYALLTDMMEKNAAVARTKIVLDIGGKRFATSKSTLLSIPNTYFHAMLSSGKWEPDEDGCYFVDRNPKHFSVILDYLRTHEKPDLSGMPKEDVAKLRRDMDYFQIPLDPILVDSVILDKNPQWLDVLNEWLPNKKLELIFRASRDGFAASDFHRCCDNRGPTLVVVQCTKGWVFGGFAGAPWNSPYSGGYIQSVENTSFLFTLKNPHSLQPARYNCAYASRELYGHASYGPTFGSGHDLHISDSSNATTSSYTSFPNGYSDTTGQGQNTFTGSHQFTVKEYEVFAVK